MPLREAQSYIVAALLALGCSSDDRGPLAYVERDGEGELPLIVALPGRGDRAERFASVFDELETPARVLVLEPPIDEGRGRAWFTFSRGWDGALDDIERLLPRIAAAIARYRRSHPTRGKPLLVGFSQGAMIAYAYAARRPNDLAAAFPVGGGIPERFVPPDAGPMPAIRAIHGTRDQVIDPSWNEESVESLRARGADATFTSVRGAPHWMTAPMRTALYDAMEPFL